MSEIRRKLLIDSGGFEKAIEEINKLPGYKSILRKFDDSKLIWILNFSSTSSTNHNLYVFDLTGKIVGQYTNISMSSTRHYGAVINNYACVYSNGNSNVTLYVFQLTENGLINILTSPTVKNWVTINFFGYKDNNNNYHMCSVSNSSKNCTYDYNITENTIRREESARHCYIQWYHYDGQYFRGILWNSNGQTASINPSYIKFEDTINVFSSYDFNPKISGSIGSYGGIVFIPIFDYKMRYEDISYEMYYKITDTASGYKNVLGLNASDPTSLSTGDIILPVNSYYAPSTYGMISYIKNDEFHAYSYNKLTGLIDLMI